LVNLSTNDAISHLITAMCHAGEVDRLTQFTFVGFQDVVERTLAFKARHSDPMAFPNYLLVLYAWHVRRGDYRNGELLAAFEISFLSGWRKGGRETNRIESRKTDLR